MSSPAETLKFEKQFCLKYSKHLVFMRIRFEFDDIFVCILGTSMGKEVGYDHRHYNENNEMGSIDCIRTQKIEDSGSFSFKHQ